MATTQYPLSPPSLEELAQTLGPALKANYKESSISVKACPDLRRPPYYLASEGLSGRECVADIGGQPNLFPEPRLDKKYSLVSMAEKMGMSQDRGHFLGAGAGPFHAVGSNCELAPNLSWEDGFSDISNLTYFTMVDRTNEKHVTRCERSSSTDCALMMNLYGSSGLHGPVLKVTARGRKGTQKSFTECIRRALYDAYGDTRPISLGGVFVINSGTAHFHVMPDFPPKSKLPWTTREQLNEWLTYHDFEAPIVCLTVFHSADPGKKLGLRMEHTHCFTVDNGGGGGHYHGDLDVSDGVDEVEYEAYFNTAKTIYRIDRPEVTLEKDLHD